MARGGARPGPVRSVGWPGYGADRLGARRGIADIARWGSGAVRTDPFSAGRDQAGRRLLTNDGTSDTRPARWVNRQLTGRFRRKWQVLGSKPRRPSRRHDREAPGLAPARRLPAD